MLYVFSLNYFGGKVAILWYSGNTLLRECRSYLTPLPQINQFIFQEWVLLPKGRQFKHVVHHFSKLGQLGIHDLSGTCPRVSPYRSCRVVGKVIRCGNSVVYSGITFHALWCFMQIDGKTTNCAYLKTTFWRSSACELCSSIILNFQKIVGSLGYTTWPVANTNVSGAFDVIHLRFEMTLLAVCSFYAFFEYTRVPCKEGDTKEFGCRKDTMASCSGMAAGVIKSKIYHHIRRWWFFQRIILEGISVCVKQ